MDGIRVAIQGLTFAVYVLAMVQCCSRVNMSQVEGKLGAIDYTLNHIHRTITNK